jgi:phosphonate transport system substrate-binding protein
VESNSNVPASNDKMFKHQSTNPLILLLAAILVAGAIGLFLWQNSYKPPANVDAPLNAVATGFSNNGPHKLDPAFKDVNGNLVADPPTDSTRLIDPPVLLFCFVATDDAEENKKQWQPFMDYLSKATGKPVEYLLVTSTHDELQAMHDGQLQVAGFNTGAVPPAVNISGFEPVCAIPTPTGGALTHTDIIVPADSSLETPQDLKGRELTLTEPSSNSGYKAPLVLLKEQFGLQPLSDIRLRYSHSHDVSIAGIVAHRYEAAAVSDDMLGRQLSAGTVNASQIRTIFKSEDFPTAGLGYVYNLKPELAQKVRDALLSFDWKGTSLEQLLDSGAQTKFVAVNYKNDWTLVRQIDDELGGLSGF